MKTLISVLVLLNSMILLANDLPFTFENLNVNFYGVAYNSNVILAYGTGSAIVRSYDRGKTWDQTTVAHDSLTIRKIKNINESFYGVLDKSIIIKSVDDGKSWQVKKLEDDNDIWDFDYTDGLLYVLRTGSINILDANFNLLKEIDIDTALHPAEIHIFKDVIYTTLDSGKIATYDINNNYKPGVIDFKWIDYFMPTNTMRRIIDNGKEIFVSMGRNVCKSGDNGKSWSIVGRDFLLYNIRDDKVFDIKQDNYSNDFMASMLMLYNLNKGSLIKITTDNKPERVINLLRPSDYAFIGNDTIVVAGYNKLISMSFDGGKSWELKSYLECTGMLALDESTCYANFNNGAICRTTNAGATWLPQRFTDPYIKSFNNSNFFYMESSGKGFFYKERLLDSSKNFLVTYDGGETYEQKLNDDLNNRVPAFTPSIMKLDSSYYFYFCEHKYKYGITRLETLDSMFNFISCQIVDSVQLVYVMKTDNNELTAIGLDRRYPLNTIPLDSASYYILKSDDGINWKNDFKLDISAKKEYLKKPMVTGSLLLVGTVFLRDSSSEQECAKLFLIDLNKKSTETLISCDSTKIFSFINFGGWTFCGNSLQELYYNKDILNTPYTWDFYPFKPYQIMASYSFGNTAYSISINHKIWKFNILKLKLKEGTSVVETPVEDRTYLYAYPAYPQPAREIVCSRVYWDRGYDINDADINVYDVTGQKVNGRENIAISKTDETSGILNWNCKEFPAGIYLIRIRLGGSTKTLRAAVIK